MRLSTFVSVRSVRSPTTRTQVHVKLLQSTRHSLMLQNNDLARAVLAQHRHFAKILHHPLPLLPQVAAQITAYWISTSDTEILGARGGAAIGSARVQRSQKNAQPSNQFVITHAPP